MPESLKWELISFAIKVLPIVLAILFAWLSTKKPTAKKAFTELNEVIKEAIAIVNQVYVDPRKNGGTWGEAEKAEARELFWSKFMELANRKAEFWLNYLLNLYGEDKLKEAMTDELESTLGK